MPARHWRSWLFSLIAHPPWARTGTSTLLRKLDHPHPPLELPTRVHLVGAHEMQSAVVAHAKRGESGRHTDDARILAHADRRDGRGEHQRASRVERERPHVIAMRFGGLDQ